MSCGAVMFAEQRFSTVIDRAAGLQQVLDTHWSIRDHSATSNLSDEGGAFMNLTTRLILGLGVLLLVAIAPSAMAQQGYGGCYTDCSMTYNIETGEITSMYCKSAGPTQMGVHQLRVGRVGYGEMVLRYLGR
jgi:hypothetical protein